LQLQVVVVVVMMLADLVVQVAVVELVTSQCQIHKHEVDN
tara:strand:+ start:129 stop:248 length:120 start_codon:yes stop_codon:yes gene_type:complete